MKVELSLEQTRDQGEDCVFCEKTVFSNGQASAHKLNFHTVRSERGGTATKLTN